MNTKHSLLLLLACAICVACTSPCRIIWTEGETNPENGKALHTLEIQNPPAGTTAPDDPAFTEDFDRFFSIITDHEYPYYDGLEICYHRH